VRFEFDGLREWRFEQIRSDMVVIYAARVATMDGLTFVGFDAATAGRLPRQHRLRSCGERHRHDHAALVTFPHPGPSDARPKLLRSRDRFRPARRARRAALKTSTMRAERQSSRRRALPLPVSGGRSATSAPRTRVKGKLDLPQSCRAVVRRVLKSASRSHTGQERFSQIGQKQFLPGLPKPEIASSRRREGARVWQHPHRRAASDGIRTAA
jgi:hypothetical protein